MAKSPWFKFYASDFLLDSKVDSLPLEAQAILIRMWSVIWIDGSIPDDPKIISRLCRIDISSVQKHMQNLMQMFHKDASGFLHSKRMEDEMSKYGHISNARKHAAEVRWNKQDTKLANANGNANGHAKAMQSESESDINLFKQNSSKRGTRLSDEFQVTDAHRQFSSKENLPSPDLLIAEFRDYWKSQPGAKGSETRLGCHVPKLDSELKSHGSESRSISPSVHNWPPHRRPRTSSCSQGGQWIQELKSRR
jgi:uncharacterized protein YdaU (DUF1376 family)